MRFSASTDSDQRDEPRVVGAGHQFVLPRESHGPHRRGMAGQRHQLGTGGHVPDLHRLLISTNSAGGAMMWDLVGTGWNGERGQPGAVRAERHRLHLGGVTVQSGQFGAVEVPQSHGCVVTGGRDRAVGHVDVVDAAGMPGERRHGVLAHRHDPAVTPGDQQGALTPQRDRSRLGAAAIAVGRDRAACPDVLETSLRRATSRCRSSYRRRRRCDLRGGDLADPGAGGGVPHLDGPTDRERRPGRVEREAGGITSNWRETRPPHQRAQRLRQRSADRQERRRLHLLPLLVVVGSERHRRQVR